MRTYRARNIPDDPKDLPRVLREMQTDIQKSARDAQDFLQLRTLNAEPSTITAGMVVLADGTNWNPGSGAGFYGYYGGAWVKLG